MLRNAESHVSPCSSFEGPDLEDKGILAMVEEVESLFV